jgi:MoxR-like ATPase
MKTDVDISKIAEHAQDLEIAVDAQLEERSREVHTSVLTLLSGQTQFLLGPPGTGKSMQIQEIVLRIEGFPEGGYFERLLNGFSTYDEIFGGFDLVLLNQNRQKRVSRRKLQTASIGFLDEVFKCNSALLNSLNLAVNERKFDDDEEGRIDIPLIALFAASNEIPTTAELAAFYDRLVFRHDVRYIDEKAAWLRMMRNERDFDPSPCISLEEIKQANAACRKIHVPDSVLEAMLDLKSDLAKTGIRLSDRRWKLGKRAVQAEALFCGEEAADIVHTRPLMHVLWNKPAEILTVESLVTGLVDPYERDIVNAMHSLRKYEAMFDRALQLEGPTQRQNGIVEAITKMENTVEKVDGIKAKIDSDTTRTSMPEIQRFYDLWSEINMRAMVEGFGLSRDEFPEAI